MGAPARVPPDAADGAALYARARVPGRSAAAARRLRAARRCAQAFAGRSQETRFLECRVAVGMGRRRAEPARPGGGRRGILAMPDGSLYRGMPCLRLGSTECDLPRPAGPDREIRRADTAGG